MKTIWKHFFKEEFKGLHRVEYCRKKKQQKKAGMIDITIKLPNFIPGIEFKVNQTISKQTLRYRILS